MLPKRAPLPRPLPGWVVAVVSLCVVFHFFAITVHVLAARSGPWLVPNFGPSPAEGPPFATEISRVTTRYYLEPLRLTSDFHYVSNHVDLPEIQFEAILRNENKDLLQTLHFPSPKDNPWVRHRHALLAEALGGDMPVPIPRGEMIAPRGQTTERVTVWYPPVPQEKKLVLKETEQHLLKDLMKDPGAQLSRPREWTLLAAKAYARYLGRKYGAASVELVRQSRDPIMPAMLFAPEDGVPPGTFDTLVSQFEEYRREE